MSGNRRRPLLRVVSSTGPQPAAVPLIIGDGPGWDEALDLFVDLGQTAVCCLNSVQMLSRVERVNRLAREGIEFASGFLIGATVDGDLPFWTLEMVAKEIEASDALFRELGLAEPSAVYVPGRSHRAVDGSYLDLITERYPVSIFEKGAVIAVNGDEIPVMEEGHELFTDPFGGLESARAYRLHAGSEEFIDVVQLFCLHLARSPRVATLSFTALLAD